MTEEYQGEERRKINGDLGKLAAEAGAKLSVLEDARAEMKGLQQSVMVLAEAIALAPTAEEVEAEARRHRIQLIVVAVAVVVVVGTLGGLLLHGQSLQRSGIRCVALQQFEHRVVNQASHDEVFNRFNIPIPPHRALPPEPTDTQLHDACDDFLPEGYR